MFALIFDISSLLAPRWRVDSIYGGGPSAFPNACDALDADAEDDGRGRSRVPREKGFDRGELWEERKQAAHRAFALRRAGNLTVSAIGQHALPSEMVLDLVNLQTDARVGAHRLDFATGQRVNEEGLSVENVIDGDDVRPAVGDAAEPRETAAAQQHVRLVFAQSGNHSSHPLPLRAR